MPGQSFFRVAVAALALCTLSFAAGVAGDLSEPPRSGVRVVLRIPPELPTDSVRAGPIARALTTQTASAAEIRRPPRQLREEIAVEPVIAPLQKPRTAAAGPEKKPDPDRAPKPVTP